MAVHRKLMSFAACLVALATAVSAARLPDPPAPSERSSFKGAQYAAVTADGKTLAGATFDTVTLWDIGSGKEIVKFRPLPANSNIRALTMMPDGKALAVCGSDDSVTIWDMATRKPIFSSFKKNSDNYALCLAFSSDGKTLAVGNESDVVKLIDVASAQQVATLPMKDCDVVAVAFAADGKTLAAAGAGGDNPLLVLWDVDKRKEIGRFPVEQEIVESLAFTTDGKTLITGGRSKNVKLWDVATLKLRATFEGHTGIVQCVAVTPDGQTLASGSRDKTVRLWDVASGKSWATLKHTSRVNSVSFAANGRLLATAGMDGKAILWDLPAPVGDPALDALIDKELKRLNVPADLIPKDKQPLFLARAEGVQIYKAKMLAGKLQWAFQGVDAVLLDYQTGAKVGTHSTGPVWVDSGGSKVTGSLRAKSEAPNAAAVLWLLLDARNDNGGAYAKVTHIQRLDTWGGLPPGTAPAKEGETMEVRYHATYVFWGAR